MLQPPSLSWTLLTVCGECAPRTIRPPVPANAFMKPWVGCVGESGCRIVGKKMLGRVPARVREWVPPPGGGVPVKVTVKPARASWGGEGGG